MTTIIAMVDYGLSGLSVETYQNKYLLETYTRIIGENMITSLFSATFGRIFLAKFKYRDRAIVVRDILETINGDPKGKTKTSIMRGANLNLAQANKYLDFLVLCDAVRAASPLRSQELARYRLTQKGLRLLRTTEMWELVMDTHLRKPA